MIRRLLVLLSLLTLLFTIVPHAEAASPSVSLSTTKDKRYVNMNFANLRGVSKVSYTLTYNTGSQQKGVEGSFKVGTKSTRASRRQILGTCSTRRCVFHANPKNFQLDVNFTLRSGGVVSVTKSL